MDAHTRRRAEAFWATRMGCARDDLRAAGLRLFCTDERRVFIARIGEAVVAVAPKALHAALEGLGREVLLEVDQLKRVVPESARFIGPAFVGYLCEVDCRAFGPAPAPDVVRFEHINLPAFDYLKTSVTPVEWEHANLEAATPPLHAVVRDGVVLAACGIEVLGGEVGHLGVLCHPACRGSGFARRVVSSAASAASAAGLLVQYQTLYANLSALAVGKAMGFEAFADTLALRWE